MRVTQNTAYKKTERDVDRKKRDVSNLISSYMTILQRY